MDETPHRIYLWFRSIGMLLKFAVQDQSAALQSNDSSRDRLRQSELLFAPALQGGLSPRSLAVRIPDPDQPMGIQDQQFPGRELAAFSDPRHYTLTPDRFSLWLQLHPKIQLQPTVPPNGMSRW